MTAAWIAQSSIVALVILAAARLLRGRAAVLREGLLLVALAKFVIPPALCPFGFLFDVMAATPAAPVAARVIGDTVPGVASSGWPPLLALVVVPPRNCRPCRRRARTMAAAERRSPRTLTPAAARVESLAASAGCRRHITLQRSDDRGADCRRVCRRIVVPAAVRVVVARTSSTPSCSTKLRITAAGTSRPDG